MGKRRAVAVLSRATLPIKDSPPPGLFHEDVFSAVVSPRRRFSLRTIVRERGGIS